MRLLVALSGTFLPPASVFAPWGFLGDGRMLVEFPGVSDLSAPLRELVDESDWGRTGTSSRSGACSGADAR